MNCRETLPGRERKTHQQYAQSRKTECGLAIERAQLTKHDEKPTCVRCLRMWRHDHLDQHDPATAGGIR